MNWDLARAFWLQRLRSPVRLILLLMLVGLDIGRTVILPGIWPTVTGEAFFITAIIGFGMISQDVSSGAAQMILVRPVGRFEYVLSRYVGTCVAALGVSLFELGVAVAIAASRGAQPEGQVVLLAALEMAAKVVSTAAVITLFTCVARGLGDLGIYAAVLVMGSFFNLLATWGHQAWAGWITDGLEWLLSTGISSRQLDAGGSELGKAALQFAITVAGCVALGHVLLRRRELNYSD